MAASAHYLAVASASGAIQLFATDSLELVGVLPALLPPAGSTPPVRPSPAVACAQAMAFGKDGSTLTASYSEGQLVTWDVQDISQPTILKQRQFHRWVCILMN